VRKERARVTKEQARVTKEQARVTKEQARVTKEQARVTKGQARVTKGQASACPMASGPARRRAGAGLTSDPSIEARTGAAGRLTRLLTMPGTVKTLRGGAFRASVLTVPGTVRSGHASVGGAVSV